MMPIEITWMIPDKILMSIWRGEITQDDMRILVEELGIILDTASDVVHTIIDLSDVSRIHDEAAYYYFGSRIPRHPNRGRIALVRAPLQGAVLADAFNRVSDREMFRLFETRDEARAFLLRHDTPPPALRLVSGSLPNENDTDALETDSADNGV
jgi:hypothetical protein